MGVLENWTAVSQMSSQIGQGENIWKRDNLRYSLGRAWPEIKDSKLQIMRTESK